MIIPQNFYSLVTYSIPKFEDLMIQAIQSISSRQSRILGEKGANSIGCFIISERHGGYFCTSWLGKNMNSKLLF